MINISCEARIKESDEIRKSRKITVHFAEYCVIFGFKYLKGYSTFETRSPREAQNVASAWIASTTPRNGDQISVWIN